MEVYSISGAPPQPPLPPPAAPGGGLPPGAMVPPPAPGSGYTPGKGELIAAGAALVLGGVGGAMLMQRGDRAMGAGVGSLMGLLIGGLGISAYGAIKSRA